MENYRKGSDTIYVSKYHLVWITKYRKKVLVSYVTERVRELIRQICKANEIDILKGRISKNHVHVFVSVPPHLWVSKLVQYLKVKTSIKLLQEYKQLHKEFWYVMCGQEATLLLAVAILLMKSSWNI
jgi:putative transposase